MRFTGETLYLEMSFLWFKNAATSKVSFIKKSGEDFSTLEAQTKWFVDWFRAYRKHVYKAYFGIVDNGKQVRTHKFEWTIIAGNEEEKKEHHLDYVKQKYF